MSSGDIRKIVAVSAGASHSLALTTDGKVLAWGNDAAGQLGDGPSSPEVCNGVPCSTKRVTVLDDRGNALGQVVALSAGENHNLAVRSDGSVVAWGVNAVGETGNPAFPGNQHAAVPVAGIGGSGTLKGAIGVAAGDGFSLALMADGTVLSWGDDSFGQLGNGAVTGPKTSPVRVSGIGGVGTLQNAVAIAAGSFHAMAVLADGTMVAWGRNGLGQLGTGETGGTATSPARVVAPAGSAFLDRVTAIEAGNKFSIALRSDGTVFAWGDDTDGQLGNGSVTGAKNRPGTVLDTDGRSPLARVVAISAGKFHGLAMRADGTGVSWGTNASGELSAGTMANAPVPVPVLASGSGMTRMIGIAGGGAHSLFLANTAGTELTGGLGGSIYTIPGSNGTGALSGTVGVSAGYYFAAALMADGTVSTFGSTSGDLGQYGRGSSVTQAPLPVLGLNGTGVLNNVVALSAGEIHTVALRADGTVVAWGDNRAGQLGHNQPVMFSNIPVQVVDADGRPFDNVIAVAAGYLHSIALRSDGSVWAWGSNGNGQIGSGAVGVTQRTPVRVDAPDAGSLTGAISISAGFLHSSALLVDGSVLTWGDDSFEQIGDGLAAAQSCSGAPCQTRPVKVAKGMIALSIRGNHGLAMGPDGTVVAWGSDLQGESGNGPAFGTQNKPAAVSGVNGAAAIAAGYEHSLVLKADGTMQAWGSNGFGELGMGAGVTANQQSPVQVVIPTGAPFLSPAVISAGTRQSSVVFGKE